MRSRTITYFLSSLVVYISLILGFPKVGRTQSTNIQFFCGSVGSQSATVARTPGGEEALVIWGSSLGGFTARERCEIVSARFHRYFVVENNNFIKLFNINGLPVLCAISNPEGLQGCEGELFTVRSWANARSIRQQMESAPWYIQGPIRQSGSDYVSFDIEAYILNEASNNSEAFLLSQ